MRGSTSSPLAAIEAIADPVMVIDRDRRIVVANAAARAVADDQSLVAKGLTCDQFWHCGKRLPGGRAWPCPLEQVVATKAPAKLTRSHTNASGRVRAFEILAAPVLDEAGDVAQIVQSCREISACTEAKGALRIRIELEELATTISTQFINLASEEIDSAIGHALRTIGEFAGADRSYVFLLSEGGEVLENTHEWCAEGIEPRIRHLKGLSAQSVPWWMERLKRLEAIRVHRAADLPPEAAVENGILQAQPAQSLVVQPMVRGGTAIGFLGLDSVGTRRTWREDFVALLRTVGDIFVSALERKRAEEVLLAHQERLRSLASELSLAEERERRRIAVGLHDSLAQGLALSKMKLQSLRERPSDTERTTALDELIGLVEGAIQGVESLAFELSPPFLAEGDLEGAARWLLEQFAAEHGLDCTFESDEEATPLDDALRRVLFRAVRELLMNVVKHANAERVRVRIWRDGDTIKTRVEDDGIGLEPSLACPTQRKAEGGFGLFSIRERLGSLGGGLEIESGAGLGTRITLSAPLAVEGRAAPAR